MYQNDHNNHLGTPQELTDQNGDVTWLSYDMAWGGQFDGYYKPQKINDCDILAHELQPIKFQGQYIDQETGLHYNRFRYFDPDVGMFVSRDPIGLLGGNNVFAYAPNPTGWVDPWGLKCLSESAKKKAREKLKERGITAVIQNKNGGLDYSQSNALYNIKNHPKKVLSEGYDGNPIQSIKYTGNYHKDFEVANMQAFGTKSTPNGYVWHHVDDYNPETNSGTMQLVKIKAHSGVSHVGGVSQYKEHTGQAYIFKTW